MTNADLSDIYRDYIACLNKQDWPNLGQFVQEEVYYNGEGIGLSVYREMLEGDFRAIPDLYFDIHLLISEPPRVASRLRFDCTPKGIRFGLHVNGKRVSFTENVFYEFRDKRIEKVWSVIDKAAIESQLSTKTTPLFGPSAKCPARVCSPANFCAHILESKQMLAGNQ
jgi:predicted ester cyclase